MAGHQVTIRYRGRGSLDQPAVPVPPPEVVNIQESPEIGDELRCRPGWFLHEVNAGETASHTSVTWVVELVPPRSANPDDTNSGVTIAAE